MHEIGGYAAFRIYPTRNTHFGLWFEKDGEKRGARLTMKGLRAEDCCD
jgi:hypothetical protein